MALQSKIQNDINVSAISNIKEYVKNIIKKLNGLEKEKLDLEKCLLEVDQNEWDKKLNDINAEKIFLNENICAVEKSLSHLFKKKLKKIKNKRARQKRKNNKLKQIKEKCLANRKKEHSKIDECLREMREKHKNFLKKKELSKTAENILFDVNKKIADAEKYIEILSNLIKLRKIRAVSHPESTNIEQENFERKIHGLIAVWKDALSEYLLEKSKLENSLKYSSMPLEDQWKKIYFGDKFAVFSDAKKELKCNEFIETRRIWDSYLVPDGFSGSSIPSGWILPNKNVTPLWKLYRTDANN